MTPVALFWLAAVSLAFTAVSAIGVKVLHDFSHHELETYCRRRKKLDLFQVIVTRHDDVALGAESFYILSAVMLVVTGALWLFQAPTPPTEPTAGELARAVIAITVILLLVGSWIPWAVVRLWSAPFLFHTWAAWVVVDRLMWPLTVGVKVMDSLMRRAAGREENRDEEEEAFEDEIRAIVNTGLREGLLEEDAREMIEGVIELGDARVANIMTPRSRVNALETSMSWGEVLDFVIEAGRTRVPVFEGKLDNVVGVLYVKDLLPELAKQESDRKAVHELLREPWFVPATTPVDDLLQDFLQTRNHLALVSDEYDGVAGVVTIEDVIEEIVGEIRDESDREVEQIEIRLLGEGRAEVLAKMQIDDLNEQMGTAIPESDVYDTLGGFVIAELGYIPSVGEIVEADDVRLVVIEADRRRIVKLLVDRPTERPAESA
ncbi:MAG: hemolysin family protein [Pirellulaceae bacterium]|nr:hemolysin family protein [Pirellulaceae bacterium]MDP7016329.1 hemolysin family protein [Pirellulaceae bacterium]